MAGNFSLNNFQREEIFHRTIFRDRTKKFILTISEENT